MRRTLSIYLRLIKVQIHAQMMYRVSFVTEAIGVALVTLLEYASLALVFQKFQNLGGWSLGQVAFLYGLAELSFGIMDLIFSGFDPDKLRMDLLVVNFHINHDFEVVFLPVYFRPGFYNFDYSINIIPRFKF